MRALGCGLVAFWVFASLVTLGAVSVGRWWIAAAALPLALVGTFLVFGALIVADRGRISR